MHKGIKDSFSIEYNTTPYAYLGREFSVPGQVHRYVEPQTGNGELAVEQCA